MESLVGVEYKRGKLPIISWICDDAAHGKLHIYGKLEPVQVAEYQSGGAQCTRKTSNNCI